jgi:hypothetical protein
MAYTDNTKDRILEKIEWARDELNVLLDESRNASPERSRDNVMRRIGNSIRSLEDAESWIRE